MKGLLWLIAVTAAAVAVAVGGKFHDSYALFVFPPYRIEFSLLFLLILLVAVFALLYAVLRVIAHILQLPVDVRAYHARRRETQAREALTASVMALFEGRYARAERDAAQAHAAGQRPALAALVAARAAHALRGADRRDQWLTRVLDADPRASVAQSVTRAELLLEQRDYVGARNVLRALHATGPKHIASLRLLLRAELGARDWEAVLRLTETLAKRGAISSELHADYKSRALTEILKALAHDRSAFEARWRRVSSADQLLSRVAMTAARQAAGLGLETLAREIIERALMQEWSSELIDAYGEASASEANVRIERAERWLRDRARDARLLLALGRLCTAAGLWGKAQNYVEASLSFGPTRESHLELARLLERLDRTADAAAQYKLAAQASA